MHGLVAALEIRGAHEDVGLWKGDWVAPPAAFSCAQPSCTHKHTRTEDIFSKGDTSFGRNDGCWLRQAQNPAFLRCLCAEVLMNDAPPTAAS